MARHPQWAVLGVAAVLLCSAGVAVVTAASPPHARSVSGKGHDWLPMLQGMHLAYTSGNMRADGAATRDDPRNQDADPPSASATSSAPWLTDLFQPFTRRRWTDVLKGGAAFYHAFTGNRPPPPPPAKPPGPPAWGGSDVGRALHEHGDVHGHPAAGPERRRTATHTHFTTSANCSHVGVLVSATGVDFECGNAVVSEAVYDAILAVQDDGSETAIDLLEEVLPSDFDFGTLIPEDTGITVNLSQLLSGQLLEDVMQELNITDPNEPVDIGELFQDGVPVLNTTQLLGLLPQSDVDQLLDEVQCDVVATSDTQCACPADYSGSRCETPRPWTCSVVVGDADYQRCVNTNGAAAAAAAAVGGYRSRLLGLPPCLFFTRHTNGGGAAPTDPAVQLPIVTTCGFADASTPPPRCNGSAITPEFIDDQAAAQNTTAGQLPGDAPFYNFRCVEAAFQYAVGAWNASLALTEAPGHVTVRFRPANLHRLSDDSLQQVFMVASDALLSPTAFTATLPTAVPDDFIAGGRVYVEVTARLNTTTASPPLPGVSRPPFQQPATARVMADQRGYTPPERHVTPVGAIVGGVVAAVVTCAAAGAFVWLRWRRRRAAGGGDGGGAANGSNEPDGGEYVKMRQD